MIKIQEAVDRVWMRARASFAWTRGLVPPMSLPRRRLDAEGSFVWYKEPEAEDQFPTAAFYTDGSVVDSTVHGCAVATWAFAALSDQGDLIAAASGVAPSWLTGINGAEAWAILMAARHAGPGSRYVTDSLNCVRMLRKGKKAATTARSRLARVWTMIFGIFDDDLDHQSLVWMPSHKGLDVVGNIRKGDGSMITRTDVDGNAWADRLAKRMAMMHREPFDRRAEIIATEGIARMVARYVGWVTWSANHCPQEVHRDAQATSSRRARAARGAGGGDGGRRGTVRHPRPQQLGGHDLVKHGQRWRCAACLRTAGDKRHVQHEKCGGLAPVRWAELERADAAASADDRTARWNRQHDKWLTGDVVWCATCGAYASQKAVLLATRCLGPPPKSGSGRTTSLLRLRRGVHPKTCKPLHGPARPAPGDDVVGQSNAAVRVWWNGAACSAGDGGRLPRGDAGGPHGSYGTDGDFMVDDAFRGGDGDLMTVHEDGDDVLGENANPKRARTDGWTRGTSMTDAGRRLEALRERVRLRALSCNDDTDATNGKRRKVEHGAISDQRRALHDDPAYDDNALPEWQQVSPSPLDRGSSSSGGDHAAHAHERPPGDGLAHGATQVDDDPAEAIMSNGGTVTSLSLDTCPLGGGGAQSWSRWAPSAAAASTREVGERAAAAAQSLGVDGCRKRRRITGKSTPQHG